MAKITIRIPNLGDVEVEGKTAEEAYSTFIKTYGGKAREAMSKREEKEGTLSLWELYLLSKLKKQFLKIKEEENVKIILSTSPATAYFN